MKKNFYLTLILILCLSSFLQAQNRVTIVDESNGYNGDYVSSIGESGSDFYAQSFVANVDTITKFGVFLAEIAAEGELILSIAADNGDGAPDVSAPLYEGTLINPSTVGAWFYEDSISVPVTAGQKYWILIDGYNNAGATGRSKVGISTNYTNSGDGMIYSNEGGIGTWSTIPSMPIAIYIEGSTVLHAPVTNNVIDEDNGLNGNYVSSIGETGSNFYAQSFVANVDTITKFGVFLAEIEAEGELILSIAADNGDGAPDVNAPLYEGTLINPSAAGAWFYEDSISVPVTVGQKYWVLIDGYNNAGATGRSKVGISTNFTNSGDGMIYSNAGGIGAWSSIASVPFAIYVVGSVIVIPSGTHEISAKSIDINVYPIPAKDVVNIISSEEIHSMEITTTQGMVVKTVIGEGKNAQIKISELPDGNYLLIIRTQTNAYVKPLLIIKK